MGYTMGYGIDVLKGNYLFGWCIIRVMSIWIESQHGIYDCCIPFRYPYLSYYENPKLRIGVN